MLIKELLKEQRAQQNDKQQRAQQQFFVNTLMAERQVKKN